jgi:hypothetical protein
MPSMKSAKLLCTLALLAAASASAAVPSSAPPALYSFEDVYRLAVAGPVAALPAAAAPAGDAAIRVAVIETAAPAELHFTVEKLPAPQGWLLLLAGLAAAGWVAHRRLAQL